MSSDQRIEVDGKTRHYPLVVPKVIDEGTSLPRVLAFPVAGDSAQDMARHTQLDSLAAEKGFFLAYLEDRYLSWPAFTPPSAPECAEPDFRFFDAVCEEIGHRHPIDEQRIYAVGISQGAGFVSLLVARRSPRIAAAVVHSGWLPRPLPDEGIHAEIKTPMLFIAGSEDHQVPASEVRIGSDCYRSEGHPVEYYEVPGLAHGWAGRQGINERIWQFLSSHRLSP